MDCILIVKHSVYADSQEGQIDNGREGRWDRRQETGTLERELLFSTSLVMLPENWVKFANFGRESCDTLAVVG